MDDIDVTLDKATLQDLMPLTLAQVERHTILTRLAVLHHNQVATAQSLGISRTTLWRRLREYGVTDGKR